jgi:hypothetical protein
MRERGRLQPRLPRRAISDPRRFPPFPRFVVRNAKRPDSQAAGQPGPVLPTFSGSFGRSQAQQMCYAIEEREKEGHRVGRTHSCKKTRQCQRFGLAELRPIITRPGGFANGKPANPGVYRNSSMNTAGDGWIAWRASFTHTPASARLRRYARSCRPGSPTGRSTA